MKFKKPQAGHNHKQVFYIIDQNVKIFRVFVNQRPYLRRFSKNSFQKPKDFRAEVLKC